MINVVFLLLIFFLMTSQLAPPDPVDITAPGSTRGNEPKARAKLFLDADGQPFFKELTGEAALLALAPDVAGEHRLLLSADRDLEAVRLAAMLRRLTAIGLSAVELQVSVP